MDRRNFLKSVTGAATAVAAGAGTAEAFTPYQTTEIAAPQAASGARVLRMALQGPDKCQGQSDFVRQFAARVRAVSDGAISFEIAPCSGSALNAVTKGDADCYCATVQDQFHVAPELAFIAGLPGHSVMDPAMVHNWLSVGGGQQLWDAVSLDLGVQAFAIANTGPSSGLWSTKPITALSAITGQKVFAEGLAGEVVKGLGAEAYSGAEDDVAQGLLEGTLIAAEVGDIPTALNAGLIQVAKYVSFPGINRFGSVIAFGISREVWDALTISEHALIESAAATTYHETLAATQSQTKMMRSACTSQFGVQFVQLGDEATQTVNRVSDIVIAHLAASSETAYRLNASYMAFLNANTKTS